MMSRTAATTDGSSDRQVDSTPLAHRLARLVGVIAKRPLPPEIADAAKLALLDFLAASFAGSGSPVARTLERALPAYGEGVVPLIGTPRTASAMGAAFFHGALSTIEDVDDSHRFATGLHMSAVTMPTVLSLAAGSERPGAEPLRAIVAGYEVAGRLCRAVDGGMRARGFHSTGAVGPFGACASAAVMGGLDARTTAQALSIAASSAGGLFAFQAEGASVRHAHAGSAASAGLLAAALAERGMTGPTAVFEGRNGIFQAFVDGPVEHRFLDSPTPQAVGEYEIENAYKKIFTACGHALPAIAATLDLALRLTDALAEVKDIIVYGYAASAALNNPHPQSIGEAKFSLPFLVATALLYGNVTARELTAETLRDHRVQTLADRVSVIEDDTIAANFPRLRSAKIVVTLQDGTTLDHYVDAAPGMPEKPVGWDAIEAKFQIASDGKLTESARMAVVDAVKRLDERPIGHLFRALFDPAPVVTTLIS